MIVGLAVLIILLAGALHLTRMERNDLRQALRVRQNAILTLRRRLGIITELKNELKTKLTEANTALFNSGEMVGNMERIIKMEGEARVPDMPVTDYNHYSDEDIAEIMQRSKRDFAVWLKENGFFMSSRDIQRFVDYEKKTRNRGVVVHMLVQKDRRLRGAGSTVEATGEDQIREGAIDGNLVTA